MRATLIFLLIPSSLACYIILATHFAIFQHYPIGNLLVMGGALAGLFHMIRKEFGIYRLALNIMGWALFLFFSWWVFMFSEYTDIEPQIAESQSAASQLAAISLENENGDPISASRFLAGATESNTLLVFFRGHW